MIQLVSKVGTGLTFIMTTWNVSHSPHKAHVFPYMSFFQFKMMLYDLLAISIWNVSVKWSILSVIKSISLGSKIHRTLYLNVWLISSCGVRAGAPHFKENVGVWHFLGPIFPSFCPLEVQFFGLHLFLYKLILFVCFRAIIKIRWYVYSGA